MSTVRQHESGLNESIHQLTPEEFLSLVWPKKLGRDETLELRYKNSSGQFHNEFLRSIPEVIARADELKADHDVYFGVATRRGRRGKKENCLRVGALFVDLDTTVLPNIEPKPTVVVNSGHGLHLYWLLKSPVQVLGHIAELEAINRGLISRFGGDPASVDLSRVLRIPGTINHKNGNKVPVEATRGSAEAFLVPDLRKYAGRVKETVMRPDCKLGKVVPVSGAIAAKLSTVTIKPPGNPSKDDFDVMCMMLRAGIAPEDTYATFADSARGRDVTQLPRTHRFDDYMQRTLGNAMAEVARDLVEVEIVASDFEGDRWRILSGKQILAGRDAEIAWAITEILETKTGLLQSGKPHGTKSLLWLCALLECVTTKLVWGKFRVPEDIHNVVFIETEDSIRLVRRRVRGFCKGLGFSYPPPGFHLICPGPFNLGEAEEKLRDIIETTKADILVLSTLQGLLAGRNYKEQSDMDPINAIAVRLQRICAIVMLTHSPQDEGKKRAVGTVTQEANYQSHMHFTKEIADGQVVTSVIFDSKETSADSRFKLKLITEPVEHSDGEIRTQVRRVEYIEKSAGGRPVEIDVKEQALTMQAGGMSVREIAEKLDKAKSTVQRWLK